MESKPVVRKLAAIVVADVVGFSRHMERDDAGCPSRKPVVLDIVDFVLR
jgi:hypothetical protein